MQDERNEALQLMKLLGCTIVFLMLAWPVVLVVRRAIKYKDNSLPYWSWVALGVVCELAWVRLIAAPFVGFPW